MVDDDSLSRNYLCVASFGGSLDTWQPSDCYNQVATSRTYTLYLALLVEHACQILFQEKSKFGEAKKP
jgi:hypothetical protein